MDTIEVHSSITDPSLSIDQVKEILLSEYDYHAEIDSIRAKGAERAQEIQSIYIRKATIEQNLSKKWPYVYIALGVLFALLFIIPGYSMSDMPIAHVGDPIPSNWTESDVYFFRLLVLLSQPLLAIGAVISGSPIMTDFDFSTLFVCSCIIGLIPLATFIVFAILRKRKWKTKLSKIDAKLTAAQAKFDELNAELQSKTHFEKMPKDYANTFAITYLISIIHNGRAYNWKEAANAYENDMHQAANLNHLQQIRDESRLEFLSMKQDIEDCRREIRHSYHY